MPPPNFREGGWTAQPGRLVTLLDMLRIYADRFQYAVHMLAMFRGRVIDQTARDRTPQIDGTTPTKLTELCEKMAPVMEALDLDGTKSTLDAIAEHMRDNPVVNDHLRFAIEHVYRVMNDELKRVAFFAVKKDAAKLYEPKEPLFGQEVHDNFQSSRYEITEAGKCIALDRPTAAVMHLMRSLEPGLMAMASEAGFTPNRSNWGDVIPEIEKRLDPLNPNYIKDRGKREFLAPCAAQFRYFKDAWRNQAMHQREKYTPEEAEGIYRAVKSFMMHLAKRLHE